VLRLFSGLTGKRMRDHHHWVLRQPQGPGPVLCCIGEGLRDDCNGGAAPLFGFDSVVETPRCAGPSIGHGVDDSVTVAGELV
jgi:hypothetical protein